MARYLTRGMVVLADDRPGTDSALQIAREYTPRTIVVAEPNHPDIADAQMVHPRRRISIDAAFHCAAREQIPWVAMRRDYAEPGAMLGQVLEATGRRARKDLPGFAVLFAGAEPRPIRRILTIIDRSDEQPSGLMVLASVAAALATDADLDVLLMGAPGEEMSTPTGVAEAVHVLRDKDLYEQGVRRAKESGVRATWITAEDVADKRSLVLEQIAEGDYDLVIDDLGSIRLGGRLGRGGRIRSSVAAEGPAQLVRAILEQTDVPLALVLDGVRLGLVPPAVIKGGAGTVLALGIIASGAPAASASPSELAAQQASVSQSAEAYSAALDQAASLAAPAEISETLQTATTTTDENVTDEDAPEDPVAAEEVAEASPVEATSSASGAEADADADAAPSDTEGASAEVAPTDVAPADLAPEEVVPEAAPEIDADDVDVDPEVSADDVAAAEDAAKQSAEELEAAEDAFDEAQQAAVEATEEVEVAAGAAEEAAAAIDSSAAEYDAITTQATDVVDDATGVTGALPGGASQEDLAAAEASQAHALAEVEAAALAADEALAEYESAAADAATAEAELDEAAAAVTAADAAHQEAAAVADATEAAYQESVANSRVTPVPGYEITTGYGVPGSQWSTGHHTGVDYAAPEGTEVVAAASGTVVYAQDDGGSYGNRIVIEHENGYYTTYNHLSDIDVEVGQEVTAGDHIGEVGNTGNSFGAHLHFEVTQGGDGWGSGSFEDPEAWLAGDIG